MSHEVLRGPGSHTPVKPLAQPVFQFLLYRRALHPELFQLKGRRVVKAGGQEVEAWLMPRAHAVRYQCGPLAICELVADQHVSVPTNGAVATFPCLGEKSFEQKFTEHDLTYVCTVQAENQPENVYAKTYEEMVGLAHETQALAHAYTDAAGGRCFSMLGVQRHEGEFHVQSCHLCHTGGVVLQTQTMVAIGQ